jgi:HD-like signal output (HDOD) protein
MGRSYSVGVLHETYGRGSHTLEDVELVEPDEILRLLRQRFASPDYRPPLLPAVAVQVHGLTRRGDASIGDVVALIERDPLLAADVVRRAGSAMYAGRAAPPRSLAQAGLRLGLQGLGDLVLQVALTSRVFRVPGLDAPMAALSRHCVVVAHAARAVAMRSQVCDADAAFLAGLLHDVGDVACLHALADMFRGKPLDLELMASAIRTCSRDAGTLVLRLWGLPDHLRRSIVDHHTTTGFDYPAVCADCAAACVLLGDHLASVLGAGTPLGESEIDMHSRIAVRNTLEAMQLTDVDLDAIGVEVAPQIAQ